MFPCNERCEIELFSQILTQKASKFQQTSIAQNHPFVKYTGPIFLIHRVPTFRILDSFFFLMYNAEALKKSPYNQAFLKSRLLGRLRRKKSNSRLDFSFFFLGNKKAFIDNLRNDSQKVCDKNNACFLYRKQHVASNSLNREILTSAPYIWCRILLSLLRV